MPNDQFSPCANPVRLAPATVAANTGQPPQTAQRILLLTRREEKRLLERTENLKDTEDLQRLQQRMYENLGIRVHIAHGFNEVRTMRGIVIELDDQPGLCRKTRQSIPAAIRRGLERNPQVAFRLLDTHDLLRDT